MQRRLDEKAASMGEPRDPSQLKEQIAYFLRERKDDERPGDADYFFVVGVLSTAIIFWSFLLTLSS